MCISNNEKPLHRFQFESKSVKWFVTIDVGYEVHVKNQTEACANLKLLHKDVV